MRTEKDRSREREVRPRIPPRTAPDYDNEIHGLDDSDDDEFEREHMGQARPITGQQGKLGSGRLSGSRSGKARRASGGEIFDADAASSPKGKGRKPEPVNVGDDVHTNERAGVGANSELPGARRKPNATRTNAATERWSLAKLKDYPQQAVMFGELPEAELKALVNDMKKRGQRTPVEILPDGTIITGHQRVRAARLLGWTMIEVIVRYDLAEAGPEAAEELFFSDNLRRRQLSPLGRARCLSRLLEIETGRKATTRGRGCLEQLKAEIAAQLGLAPRSVNRYLLILRTPPIVRDAFDRGELSLTVAGRVALLKERQQAEIAGRIEAGEKARAVVVEYLGARAVTKPKVSTTIAGIVRTVAAASDVLADRMDEVRVGDDMLEKLRGARGFLDIVIEQGQRRRRDKNDQLAEMSRLAEQRRG